MGGFQRDLVDPTDDTSFWTLQEYAMTHDTFTDINNNVRGPVPVGNVVGEIAPTPPAHPLPPEPPPPPPPSGGDATGAAA